MILNYITLQQFRAHESFQESFDSGANLITGPNGIGKTNILEAIHFLCLTRSFAASRDRACVRSGAEYFLVRGEFTGDNDRKYAVSVRYSADEGKTLAVNKVEPDRLSDHIGRFPVVTFSPDDYALTAAGPDERRRFLDNMLSQGQRTYLADLMAYRKSLRQRNALLQAYPRPAGFTDSLDAWSHELVMTGARIIARRQRDISLINTYLDEIYGELKIDGEETTLRYESVVDSITGKDLDEDQIRTLYLEKLADGRDRELTRRRTLIGPHRDELGLFINDRPLRNYASQGQHRTFAMALKFAKYQYLTNRTGVTPILLLDDAFDHLDPDRIASYVRLIRERLECQTFITTASPAVLDKILSSGKPYNRIDLSEKVGPVLRDSS